MRPIIGINCELDFPQGKGPKAQLDQRYVEAVEKAGGIPLLISPLQDPSHIGALLSRIDGLILSGGDDIDPKLYGDEAVHPTASLLPKEKESFDLKLAREAVRRQIPTLGICYGMQLLAVAFKGTLHQHLPENVANVGEHRKVDHGVSIDKDSKLHEIVGRNEIDVHSSHHQAVRDAGPNFKVVSKSPDGVIEGMEGCGQAFLIGVQWHPERKPETPSLFRALVEAASSKPQAG